LVKQSAEKQAYWPVFLHSWEIDLAKRSRTAAGEANLVPPKPTPMVCGAPGAKVSECGAVGYNIVDNEDAAALLHLTHKGCPMTRVLRIGNRVRHYVNLPDPNPNIAFKS
jgi:hypothetical protein